MICNESEERRDPTEINQNARRMEILPFQCIRQEFIASRPERNESKKMNCFGDPSFSAIFLD